MTSVAVHCHDCGVTAPPLRAETMDGELAAAGWAISHGATYCPACASSRGLSRGPDGGQPGDRVGLRPTGPPAGREARALGLEEAHEGTLETRLGVRETRGIIRSRLELNPAGHRERWDEERRVIAGLVLGRRLYAAPWWGRGAFSSPYSYHLRGRLRRRPEGGCELRWRIYRGSVAGWISWALLSLFVFLIALASLTTFATRGGTGALLFGLGALAVNVALIAWPRLSRDRWKTLEMGMLTGWIGELEQELQSGQS